MLRVILFAFIVAFFRLESDERITAQLIDIDHPNVTKGS
jgi:hypothetical protein